MLWNSHLMLNMNSCWSEERNGWPYHPPHTICGLDLCLTLSCSDPSAISHHSFRKTCSMHVYLSSQCIGQSAVCHFNVYTGCLDAAPCAMCKLPWCKQLFLTLIGNEHTCNTTSGTANSTGYLVARSKNGHSSSLLQWLHYPCTN